MKVWIRIYHMLGEEGGVADYEGLDKEGGRIYHMLGEEGNEVEEKTYEGILQALTVLDTYSTPPSTITELLLQSTIT